MKPATTRPASPSATASPATPSRRRNIPSNPQQQVMDPTRHTRPVAATPRVARLEDRVTHGVAAIPRLDELLARPAEQRLREYKYRCAQALIFGLPVLGLAVFGPSLGGPEAPRWIAILQALLTGWIVFVGAAGMLFERLVLLPRKGAHPELLVSLAAVALYLATLIFHVLPILITAHVGRGANFFP